MSTTPIGDWIRKTWPDNPGATHYLGPGDDPGCCAGGHARCTYLAGWREALLALAAEFDGKARDWHKKASHEAAAPDAGGTAAAIGRAYEGAARLARQRAQGSPGSPAATSPAQEDPDLTLVGLSPAQAYMAGVKAERQRIVELATEHEAACQDGNGDTESFADVIQEGL